ncbi:hypothetical protein [Fodinibius sp. AD559]|uniref:hypothetical protein n=1 Tax=Fodinibius sp. AD559 TaxID=3424179 RepID=UPI004046ACEF
MKLRNVIYPKYSYCLIVFVFFFSSQLFAQQQEKARMQPISFYEGAIAIEKISGFVELHDGENPETEFKVVLRNEGESNEQIEVGFRGAQAKKVSLDQGESQSVSVSPITSFSGEAGSAQKADIDMVLLFNGEPVQKPVGAVNVEVRLPQQASGLIRANKQLKRGDGNEYYLSGQRVYLTELSLVYTTGPVTLDIKKQIRPTRIDEEGPVKVTLRIKNRGPDAAQNVLIEEDYDPRDFSGEGENFEMYQGKVNDRRLLWSRTIDRIPAGETVEISYELIANMPVHDTKLSATTASIDGELVGVSNEIFLAGE